MIIFFIIDKALIKHLRSLIKEMSFLYKDVASLIKEMSFLYKKVASLIKEKPFLYKETIFLIKEMASSFKIADLHRKINSLRIRTASVNPRIFCFNQLIVNL